MRRCSGATDAGGGFSRAAGPMPRPVRSRWPVRLPRPERGAAGGGRRVVPELDGAAIRTRKEWPEFGWGDGACSAPLPEAPCACRDLGRGERTCGPQLRRRAGPRAAVRLPAEPGGRWRHLFGPRGGEAARSSTAASAASCRPTGTTGSAIGGASDGSPADRLPRQPRAARPRPPPAARAGGRSGRLRRGHVLRPLLPVERGAGRVGFAWSWLGCRAAGHQLPFGVVNAPGQRYHPAIIAQAAATLEVMFPGRFWMAIGAGQNVNEHITGERWPAKDERNERLRECAGSSARSGPARRSTTAAA